MKNIFLKTILLLTVAIGFTGCVTDDRYSTPNPALVTYTFTPTKTVAEINAAAVVVSTDDPVVAPVQYTADDIIEAYVTSSDEKGTFYKSVSFQTIPSDGSAPIGFSVPINVSTLYGRGFNPGRKIYIKLNGLYTGKVYGSLQIGSLYEGTIGRISENEWQNHLFPSDVVVSEETFVRTMNLSTAYADVNQNTLIELNMVQFADGSLNRTYYDVDSGGGATNHMLVATTGGAEQIIRFSSFAPFTGKQVPSLSGKIRGVLTKYDTDFQFIVRTENDIKLNNPRVFIDNSIGGSALVYSGSFTEPFTSYTASNQQIFPGYLNNAVTGSRYWQVKTFSGNKYIQMSSFGGTPEANRTLFLVPVDMTAASTFSFKTASGFDNGSTLKVYYTTNYVPGNHISTATLVNITSVFNIPAGPSNNYSSFASSGPYNIPAGVTGNGFFIFEYTGNGNGITTTMQIDDITVN